MTSRDRLEFALRELKPSDWQRFESLASVFLSQEFPSLRPMAAYSGDDGQDGVLWTPAADDSVVLQYSVREDSAAKIRATARRLAKTSPNASLLIYATSQTIDPEVQKDLRAELRKDFRITLDIRVRAWFLDHVNDSAGTREASLDLTRVIVDPLLATSKVYEHQGQAINDYELRVAFVHLTLHHSDEAQSKGLTRACFEALTRAVLRHTHLDSRLARAEIHAAVARLMPSHDTKVIARHTDAALRRLEKSHIRHWTKENEFCLTHQEKTDIESQLIAYSLRERKFEEDIEAALRQALKSSGPWRPKDISPLTARVRRVVERALMENGEWFADAALRSGAFQLPEDRVASLIAHDAASHPVGGPNRATTLHIVRSAIEQVLAAPSTDTSTFLNELAHAYTLMAFLRETPDVQSVVEKMFGHCELWFDANALLPLLAESLCEMEARHYTHLFQSARSCGMKLRCTEGVLEEVASHLHRASIYSRTDETWRGPVPFLYNAWFWSDTGGHSPTSSKTSQDHRDQQTILQPT